MSSIQALRVAQGSLKELETHVLLAHEVTLMNKVAAEDLLGRCDEVGRLLRALIRSLLEKAGAE